MSPIQARPVPDDRPAWLRRVEAFALLWRRPLPWLGLGLCLIVLIGWPIVRKAWHLLAFLWALFNDGMPQRWF